MGSKITLPRLATLLAQSSGKSKKLCDEFLRVLFATIAEAIYKGESVKVKGFGTFKLVRVDERKSVNVSSGEEYVIPAHYKLNFIPSKELAAKVNSPFAMFDTVELSDLISEEELNNAAVAVSEQDDMSDTMIHRNNFDISDNSDISHDYDTSDASDASDTSDEPNASVAHVVFDETDEADESDTSGDSMFYNIESEGKMTLSVDNPEEPIAPVEHVSGIVPEVSEELSESSENAGCQIHVAPDMPHFLQPTELVQNSEPKSESESEPTSEEGSVAPSVSSSATSAPLQNGFPMTCRAPESRRSFGRGFLIGFASAILVIFIGCSIGYWYVNSTMEKILHRGQIAVTQVSDTLSAVSDSVVEADSGLVADEVVPTHPSDREDTDGYNNEPVYDVVTTTRYLTTIAQEHYGNYEFWPYIYEENASKLGHPNKIRPGTKVMVPDLKKLGVDPKSPQDEKTARRKGAAIYSRYK